MTDTAELRKLAEAATPGPWEATDGVVWIDTREQVCCGLCCGRGYQECCGEPDVIGGQEKVADANAPDAAFIAAFNPQTAIALLDALTATDAEIAALKLQAQSWSMEAKAQKATVCECYQAATGAKGEPGDWNGAKPIREALAERDAEIAALKEKVKRLEGELYT